MIKKEDGYDEFLAEKIQCALEDRVAGRIMSLEEATISWQHTIERKALELALLDEELKQELAYA